MSEPTFPAAACTGECDPTTGALKHRAGWPDWLAALAREYAAAPTPSTLIRPTTSEDGLR